MSAGIVYVLHQSWWSRPAIFFDGPIAHSLSLMQASHELACLVALFFPNKSDILLDNVLRMLVSAWVNSPLILLVTNLGLYGHYLWCSTPFSRRPRLEYFERESVQVRYCRPAMLPDPTITLTQRSVVLGLLCVIVPLYAFHRVLILENRLFSVFKSQWSDHIQ